MANMGRPKSDNPLDKKVSVRFTQGEYEVLLEYAKNHDMTVTQAVRLCVERYILTQRK